VPDTLVFSGDDDNWVWLAGEVGVLAAGPHDVRLDSSWHYGRWDTVILTSDADFVPPARPPFPDETAPDLSLLAPEQLAAYEGMTVWNAPPGDNCDPASRPPGVVSTTQQALTACTNERVPVALNVTDWTGRSRTVRVSPASPRELPPATTALPATALRLLHAVPLASALATPLADALPELDGAGLLQIPGGETRQLWCEVNTAGLKAGFYSARLLLRPLDRDRRYPVREVELRLEVLPVELPLDHPLTFYTNDYDTDLPGTERDMPEHYVNLYQNSCVQSYTNAAPDFSAMDAWVRREMAYPGARGILFEEWWFRGDASWKDAGQRGRWVEGVRRWATHVREELGLGYDDFALHIYDEVAGASVDDFLLAREIVREADPQVRVTMTLGQATTLEEAARMVTAVDIWAPYMPLVLADGPLMALLRQTGKPIWPYHCAEDKRHWPTQNYRVWPWQLYRAGVQGLWLWTYHRPDPWDGRAWDGGVVYPGNRQVVTSRRWELLRQGLQDWLLLQKAEQAGCGETVAAAVAAVVAAPEDPLVLESWRARVLSALRRTAVP
jgi:hypothetical protein